MLALMLLVQDDLASLKVRWDEERNAPLLNRVLVIRQIGELKTDEAADFLYDEIYLPSRSPEVQQPVIAALAANGSPRAMKAIRSVLDRGEEKIEVRRTALEAMAGWKTDEALEIVSRFARNRSTDNLLRDDGIRLLAGFPIERTKSVWMKLSEDNDPKVRAPALRALAPLKDKDIVARALEDLNNPKMAPTVRAAAVSVVRAMGDAKHVKMLLEIAFEPGGPIGPALVEALSTLTDPEAVRLVVKYATDSARPHVRDACVRAAATLPDSVGALTRALDDAVDGVRESAVDSLARVGTSAAWAVLRDFAQKGSRRTHIEAIARLGRSAENAALLMTMADSREAPVRVAALLALGELAPEGALAVLVKHLDSDHWPTRAAAIRSLGCVRSVESIERLMARLEKEEGRLRWDIALALARLTGKMLGYTAEPWNDWWKVNGATFAFPPEGGRAEVPEAATKAYYGIPLLSKRVTFCIDASGSMNTSVQSRPVSKLEDARRVLKATLKGLEADVEFNFILFRDAAEAWRGELQPATEENIGKAIDALSKAKADGGTNLFGTLAVALADPEVDTVFLLSDGEPSEGTIVDPAQILREVGALNRTRLVVFHTIALNPSPFMKELAAQTGGKYVER